MENNEMQWNQTAGLLASTLQDLKHLYASVYCADIGELPEEFGKDAIGQEAKQERREIPERELFFDGLLGIYHGLNYAWATRRIDLEKAEREGGLAFEVGVPTEGAFAKLVPTEKVGRADSTKIGDKPVSLPTVRSSLQMAVCKLGSLCYRLSSFPGVDVKAVRPKGFDPDAEKKPFDEAEFELRLFQIYSSLNEAWNCRFENGWSHDPETVDKNCEYPLEVLAHD